MSAETETAERYGFGENWRRFLATIDPGRIAAAEAALTRLLGSVEGLTLLDVGGGSGLSSLAALRLGAARVHSFDYDPESVAVARALRERYVPEDSRWTIDIGNALAEDLAATIGQADLVYSWGVLHHTGAIWRAIDNVAQLVKPGGLLALAIYNTGSSRLWTVERWRRIKRLYNRSPELGKRVLEWLYALYDFAHTRRWLRERERGMDPWTDIRDWLGGYPYETATADELIAFLKRRGFEPEQINARPSESFSTNELTLRRTLRADVG